MDPHLAQFTLTGIIADNPWLADFECHGCPSVEAHEFFVSYEWLSAQRQPLNLRRSAYSLKRDVEQATAEHVGERAFLASAIACGYTVRFANKTGTAFLGI